MPSSKKYNNGNHLGSIPETLASGLPVVVNSVGKKPVVITPVDHNGPFMFKNPSATSDFFAVNNAFSFAPNPTVEKILSLIGYLGCKEKIPDEAYEKIASEIQALIIESLNKNLNAEHNGFKILPRKIMTILKESELKEFFEQLTGKKFDIIQDFIQAEIQRIVEIASKSFSSKTITTQTLQRIEVFSNRSNIEKTKKALEKTSEMWTEVFLLDQPWEKELKKLFKILANASVEDKAKAISDFIYTVNGKTCKMMPDIGGSEFIKVLIAAFEDNGFEELEQDAENFERRVIDDNIAFDDVEVKKVKLGEKTKNKQDKWRYFTIKENEDQQTMRLAREIEETIRENLKKSFYLGHRDRLTKREITEIETKANNLIPKSKKKLTRAEKIRRID